MICPNCGAENSEEAQFCNLCLQPLERPPSPERETSETTSPEHGGRFFSPGEWGRDVVPKTPVVSARAEKRVKRLRLRWAVYVALAASLVAWLVLSFTVWGNPSPAKRARQLIDALNAKDKALFVSLFPEAQEGDAERLYQEAVGFLGQGGGYQKVSLKVEQHDPYEAWVYLEGGTVTSSDGTKEDIDPSDGLVVHLQSYGGKWRVHAPGTDLVP